MTALFHRDLVVSCLREFGTRVRHDRCRRGDRSRVRSSVVAGSSGSFPAGSRTRRTSRGNGTTKWRGPPAMGGCRDRRQGGVRSRGSQPADTVSWRRRRDGASKPDSRCCSPTRRWRSRTQSSGRPMEHERFRGRLLRLAVGRRLRNENASSDGSTRWRRSHGRRLGCSRGRVPHRLRVHRPSTRARLPQAGGDAGVRRRLGFDFAYSSTPNWDTYSSFLELCRTVNRDLADLGPRDQIDIQSFLWVQGSDEY